jgi:histidine phosphotransfer protein HptB
MDSEPLILDPAVQEALRDVMRDDYDLLVETFLEDIRRRIGQLEQSLQMQDWTAFGQTAHSLRGSCGNMGALAMQHHCELAEVAATQADDIGARQALDALKRLDPQVCQLLRP